MQVASQRHQVAADVHAHAGLGTNQPDAVCVHAAECGRVQRHVGLGALPGLGGHRTGAVVDARGAGRDVKPVGPDARIDFQRTGQQIHLAQVGAVQAVALNAELARRDVKADAAVGSDLRPAGRQRGAVGVQKAAAIAGDAGGVGDDDVCPVAGHLQGAQQLRRVRRRYLVEDGGGALVAQHDVARDLARQLRLAGAAAVVEHRARRAHVELRVAVVRDPASRRRRDVDDRHPVGDAHGRLGAGNALVHRDRQGLRQHGRPDLQENDGPDNHRTKLGHHAYPVT
ncbi:hypothetical protein D3C86_622610 [compost metagenome]